jgi:hypothetical protein
MKNSRMRDRKQTPKVMYVQVSAVIKSENMMNSEEKVDGTRALYHSI